MHLSAVCCLELRPLRFGLLDCTWFLASDLVSRSRTVLRRAQNSCPLSYRVWQMAFSPLSSEGSLSHGGLWLVWGLWELWICPKGRTAIGFSRGFSTYSIMRTPLPVSVLGRTLELCLPGLLFAVSLCFSSVLCSCSLRNSVDFWSFSSFSLWNRVYSNLLYGPFLTWLHIESLQSAIFLEVPDFDS